MDAQQLIITPDHNSISAFSNSVQIVVTDLTTGEDWTFVCSYWLGLPPLSVRELANDTGARCDVSFQLSYYSLAKTPSELVIMTQNRLRMTVIRHNFCIKPCVPRGPRLQDYEHGI